MLLKWLKCFISYSCRILNLNILICFGGPAERNFGGFWRFFFKAKVFLFSNFFSSSTDSICSHSLSFIYFYSFIHFYLFCWQLHGLWLNIGAQYYSKYKVISTTFTYITFWKMSDKIKAFAVVQTPTPSY